MIGLEGQLPQAAWRIGSAVVRSHITIHYHGPPVPEAARTSATPAYLANIARYHMQPGSLGAPNGGDGIQYHLAINDNGAIYRCRPDSAQLWHCGTLTGNSQSLAIHMAIGGDQQPTARALQSLTDLLYELRRRYNIPADRVVGHMEWSPTSCPGVHLMRWIVAYRDREGQPPVLRPLPPPLGQYVVRYPAVVRQEPGRGDNSVMTLQRWHPVVIDHWTSGEEHYGSPWWGHWETGLGFIHSSSLQEV